MERLSRDTPTIAVIGSLNVDLVTYLERIPDGGETLTASSFHTGLGGKGANQAVACAKLSRRRHARGDPDAGTATVQMIGAVGDDAYGRMMTAGLRGFGVDVSGVARRPGLKTGVAVILVEETTGQNRIMLSAEANASLQPADFHDHLVPGSSAGGGPRQLPDLVVLQLEIPLATVLQILETAKRHSIPVLLNPAPAQPLPDAYYRCVRHLVVNETEAMQLSGCAASDLDPAVGLGGLAKTCAYFHGRGVENVLLTLGGQGVYYSASPRSGGDRSGLVPAEHVTVVDTTAAGDTFAGAYALQVVRHRERAFDIADAVRVANHAAAKAVQRRGAQESIPWSEEVDLL